jgi:hypothetical protein
MANALRCNLFQTRTPHRDVPLKVTQTTVGSPRRAEAEAFIRDIFAQHYNAEVPAFAPNLMMIETEQRIIAATGWRCAGSEPLYLENYLDIPIEAAMARLAGQPVQREHIVEVGNLATSKAGASLDVILTLAAHLDQLGYKWVVFTATRTLVGIFSRLRLPLLALAHANPARLGGEAAAWGSYYETEPIVVAGKIRIALECAARHD